MTDIHGVKGDIYQTGVVAKYEMLKYIRGKKIYVFSAIMLLVLFLMTILPYLIGDGLSEDPTDLMVGGSSGMGYASMISLFVIFGATLFASGALVSEFEERTALLTFTRPIKKESVFFGKMLASFLFTAMFILAYYLIVIVISLIVAGGVADNVLPSIGISMLYILAVNAVAFLISAFLKKGSTAAIMTFILFLLIFQMLTGIMMIFGIEPVYDLTYASTAIQSIISGAVTSPIIDSSTGDTLIMFGREMYNYVPTVGLAVSIMVVWLIVATAIAMVQFKRREF